MATTYNGRFMIPEEPKMSAGWLIAGLVMIPTWPSFFTLVASICCFVKFGKQAKERRLYRLFNEYCAVIGMRGRVKVKELKSASPSGMGVGDVRRNLQQMISRGYFGSGAYIDLARNELVLPDVQSGRAAADGSPFERGWQGALTELMCMLRENLFQGEAQEDDGVYRPEPGNFDYQAVTPESKSAPAQQSRTQSETKNKPKSAEPARQPAQPPKRTYAEELERTLNELYELNAKIDDEGVSHRIDHIGTLTAGIFRAVIEKPEREQDVRKFMNYYLPTTLKLLHSYDMLEDQHVQSQNIAESRKKIEDVLDMLIEAYGRQLDRLYRNDALDIATDIDVLESMMAKDGLTSKGEMPL